MKVWYLLNGIVNIILMHDLEKLYQSTYDGWERFYIINTPQGQVQFHKDKQGLPYINLEQSGQEAAIMLMQNAQEQMTKGTALMQTVRGNYEGYTKKEVLQANEMQCAQAMIGNPSEGNYRGMVSRNMIKNCLITPTNITNARDMFGPDLSSIQGKTVRCTPAPVVADYVAAPSSFVEQNKIITMAADLFFVDGTAFLLTLSRNIKFVMVEHVPVQTAKVLVKHMECVLQVY